MAGSKQTLKRTQKAYLEQRQASDQARIRSGERRDHWLLTLASGSLALSITFLGAISASGGPSYPGLIITAWVLLLLSIITTIGGMHLTKMLYASLIRILDDCAQQGPDDFHSRVRQKQLEQQGLLVLNNMLTVLSTTFFCLGLAAWAAFAFVIV